MYLIINNNIKVEVDERGILTVTNESKSLPQM